MSDQWYDRHSAARDISRICRGNICREELTPIVDKPPILASVEDDTELEIMFGRDCKLAYGINDFNPPDPALLGHIPNMIDMVREHDSENINCQTPTPNDDFFILEISRLNPEVPAFQPNIAKVANKVEDKNEVNLPNGIVKEYNQIPSNISPRKHDAKKENLPPKVMSMPEMSVDTEKDLITFDDDINIKKPSKLDFKNITPEEAEELKNILKTEINGQHDNKCSVFKKKLNRNVAIANLLKLQSVMPLEATSSKKTEAITLMPPDYFINTHPTNIQNTPKIAETIEEQKKEPCLKNKDIYDIENELEKENRIDRSERVSKVDADSNTKQPALDDEDNDSSRKTPPEQPTSTMLQRSIDRVNEWFEVTDDAKVVPLTPKRAILKTSKIDAKPGFVLGGPITFKKKSSVDEPSSSSPIRGSSPTKPRPKQFKPSQFSSQLLKKYNEQTEKTVRQSEDMWGRVQREMREREYEKKKKLKESDPTTNPQ